MRFASVRNSRIKTLSATEPGKQGIVYGARTADEAEFSFNYLLRYFALLIGASTSKKKNFSTPETISITLHIAETESLKGFCVAHNLRGACAM